MDSDPLEKRVESLEDDVYQLNSTTDRLEVSVGNAITGEQLEKAKSDLQIRTDMEICNVECHHSFWCHCRHSWGNRSAI